MRTNIAILRACVPMPAALIAAAVALGGCGASSPTPAPAVAAGAQPAGTPSRPIAPRPAAAATAATAAAPSTTSATTATARTPTPVPAATAPAPAAAVPQPQIVWDPIPFGPQRKAEMVRYVARHYGSFMAPTYRLVNPHVIVIHYTETPDFSSTFNTFAPDTPDSELHELPNTCAHFVIDAAGVIHQLVSLSIMCRHTVGLNWTAIGIEHVGFSDAQVLGDSRQMTASLRLVRWLRCRYNIPIRDVIGHNESLSSPYHREDVPALRTQTHSDFNRTDMDVYRARLAAAGGC